MKCSSSSLKEYIGIVAFGLAVLGVAAGISHATQQTASNTALKAPVVAPEISPAEAQRAVSSAKDLSTAFRFASEKVLPAVVTIETRPKAVGVEQSSLEPKQRGPGIQGNPFEGTPFEDLFKDGGFDIEGPSLRPQPHGNGMGSGVVIDESGIILTNNHVVAGDGDVTVRLYDGREFKGSNVWTDPKSDIAVVKIDADHLTAAKIGNSDAISVGDWVLALGQPFGLESTVTAGIISAKHRGIGITERENFLQTDAAINPGNSGGPLVNLDGEVVGINTAISSRSGGSEGVGFAVPINVAHWVADQLAHGGKVHRAYLGVGIQPVSATLAAQFNVKPREGVVVTNVLKDTPAAKAGLEVGDVIVEYAGRVISSPNELQLIVEQGQLGHAETLTIIRNGKRMNLNFTPEELPGTLALGEVLQGSGATTPEKSRLDNLGLEVSTLDANVAEQLGVTGLDGVVITSVRSDSPADRAGLSTGMVITQINRHAVKSLDDFNKAVKESESNDTLLLLVRSQDGSRFVVVR